MRTIKRSIDINAPVERLFEFITTPQNLPLVWPSMVDVSNVERKADGGHNFDWIYKMAGIKFHGHARTVKVDLNAYSEVRNDTGIPSTFKWTFTGTSAGSSKLLVEATYELPTPVLGKIAEAVLAKVNEHEMDTLLANLKATLEGIPVAKKDASAVHHA